MRQVNEKLREEHFQQITDERARAMYDRLCAACDSREDGMTDPDQMIVCDIAYEEQIKGMLLEDIGKRGIGCERRNGRQVYWQDNKSLAHFRAYSDQQRKQLGELRLTPVRRKAAAVPIEDDFDQFE